MGTIAISFLLLILLFPNSTWTGIVAKAQIATGSTSDSNAADRVALNKQYLQQANVLINQMFEEEKNLKAAEDAKKNATASEQVALDQQIAASNQKIDQILQQIQDIDKLNQALFVPPPDVEQNMLSGQKELIDKYLNKTSPNFVANNPVEIVKTDWLNRTLLIVVNPDKLAPDKTNLPTETSINGVPIEIQYGKTVLTDCNPYDRNGVCRPVIGGISTSLQSPTSLNTIGYAATWIDGSVGVVVAGHSAQAAGNVMVQPYNQPSDRIGVVQSGVCNANFACDWAFVKTDSGVGAYNSIFNTDGTWWWQINNKEPASQQAEGTIVYKSGATTAVTSGQILNCEKNYMTTGTCEAAFYVQGGDSGAPVFIPTSSTTATLLGMEWGINGNNYSDSYYHTQDQIQQGIHRIMCRALWLLHGSPDTSQ